MQVLLLALGGLLLLLAIAAVFGFLLMKKYLRQSQKDVEGTMSGIAEEIDSYQEKTQ
ncbi:MAG: hypothetical protein ACE5HB_00685 [Terriglobia bacterium]